MTCGYIDDGYTLDGYIKESPGIHPAVHFKYRPTPHDQRLRLFERFMSLPAEEQIQRITKHLADKVVSWDLKDRQGRTLNAKEATVYRKLVPPLQERLLDIVCCVAAPDVDPESPVETPADGCQFTETGEKNLQPG